MNGWINRNDRYPEHGQWIEVKGVPSGSSEIVTMGLQYNEEVGLIENITHWRPWYE